MIEIEFSSKSYIDIHQYVLSLFTRIHTTLYSRVHATLYVTMSVGRSVRRSVGPKSLRFFRRLVLNGDQI